MKSRVLLMVLAQCCVGAVMAQVPPAGVDASPEAIARERARIEQERRQQDARFTADAAACYQRFAVNDCLREVRVRRRAVFEDLHRQEIALNDAERRSRGAEQLRRMEEKMSPQAQQEDADRRGAAQQDQQERNERAANKRAERAQAEADRSVRAPRPPASSGPSSAEQAESRRRFEEKQRQAQERRAQQEKAQAEKAGKPPVPPLPSRP